MTKKQHILSSIVFLLISGVVFFSCYTKLGETSLAIHPYMMPTLTSGLMTAMCILRLIVGLRMPPDDAEKAKKKLIEVPVKSLITMGLVLVYALTMKSVGFILTTFVFMMVQMFVLKEGKKNWPLMLGISLVMSVGIYFLFTRVFNIMLPAGVLSFL